MKFFIFALALLGCGFCKSKKVGKSAPRVTTPLGPIEGYHKTSSNGREYEAYEGIPYAQPPTGEFRFQVARRTLPWKGILMAKEFGSTCMQYSPRPGQEPPGNATGSEDCLYMNIYTNNGRREESKPPTNLFPVILFIHGGAFQFGSGNQFESKYLLGEDVLLVTINYRLGPLGFLSTENGVVPGNMGLKDQVIALRWVRDNIEFFGGDPSRVTIVGVSAGGVSVHYHILSKLSKGLFQGGMSLSGTVLDCWAQTENSLEKAKKLATIVGCPSHDVRRMVNCLKLRPAEQLTQAIGEFMPWLYNPYTPFGPVVEKDDGEFTFIDRPPIETLTYGATSQDVPWITSDVSEEGLYPAAVTWKPFVQRCFVCSEFVAREDLLAELNEKWETIGPHLLDFNYTIPEEDRPAVARLIRQHYLGSKPIDRSTVNQTVQMVGDRLFVYNAERAAKLHARANRGPVRFYYFSYRGAHSLSELFSGTSENFGVSHADDMAYVLDSIFDPTTTAQDLEMQQVMVNFWVSYATNGTPDVGVEWPTLSRTSCTDEFHYLHIAGPNKIGMDSASNFGQKKFWRTINFQENIL